MSLVFFNIDKGNLFKSFLINRDLLISMLERNELSKREFLENNMRLLSQISFVPKTPIASVEEGVFSYQYYNGYAKYNQLILQDLRESKSSSRRMSEVRNKIENYYREKDKATLSLLEFVEYKNVEAYYISLNSRRLQGELYEVFFKDYERIIFHSKSGEIKDKLMSRGLFINEIRDSKICDYVNSEY
ncbi:MAG: hypothetical protein GX219_10070 [Tissierellia bacterium]|nr:hypothetical protein [Tissierellia bacterium]